jgi:O-antigen/teichoic acid export membrane protein
MSGEAAPRLKTNFAILVLGDAAGKLVNVFVFSRLGRILEPERYGQLEFVMAAVFVGALVIEAGLGPWGARAVARDPAAASLILGRIMALRAIILVIVLVLLGAFSGTLAVLEGGTRASLLLSAALMLVPKPLLCEFLFQGRHEMGTVTSTMFLEPLLSLIGTVVLVREPAHLTRVPFILAGATASVAVAQQAVARLRGITPEFRHGLGSARATLRASLPLGLSTLAWAIRFFSPMIAVGLAASGPGAGAFGAAHRLTVSIHAVVWLYFFNLLPVWSRQSSDAAQLAGSVRHSVLVTAALAAMLGGGIFLVAPLLAARELYGAEYEESVRLLRLLVLVPVFAWISGNFRFGLIAKGALVAELRASLAGAAAAVVAFAVLGSRVDPWSAATVFCSAEALTLVTAWWLWRRHGTSAVPPTTTALSGTGTPR